MPHIYGIGGGSMRFHSCHSWEWPIKLGITRLVLLNLFQMNRHFSLQGVEQIRDREKTRNN